MSLDQSIKNNEELISSSPLLGGIQDKFRTVLNNVKYGWTVQIKPSFNLETIVHFLGKEYKESKEDEEVRYLSLDDFSDDFSSCLWFTYRTNFEPITTKFLIETSTCYKKNFGTKEKFNLPQEMRIDDTKEDDIIIVDAIDLSRSFKPSKSYSSFSSSVPLSTSLASSPSENMTKKYRSRSEYHVLDDNSLSWTVRTSDCGWGCMLRSCQMLLGHAILRHLMKNDYKTYIRGKLILKRNEENIYRKIIQLFGDSIHCPFSIHRFLLLSNKQPGTWFGPSMTASILVNVIIAARCEDELFFDNLEVYVANDRVIIREQIFALFKQNYAKTCEIDSKHFFSIKHTGQLNCTCIKRKQPRDQDASILLIVPMKLGSGQKIDMKMYGDALKIMMSDPCFVGVIGGKPNRSVFIAGFQDSKYIYFEPHIKQNNVDVFHEKFPLKSFSCFVPQMGRFERLDSSLAIGFLFSSINDVNSFFQRHHKIEPKILEVISVNDRLVSKKNSSVCVITEDYLDTI